LAAAVVDLDNHQHLRLQQKVVVPVAAVVVAHRAQVLEQPVHQVRETLVVTEHLTVLQVMEAAAVEPVL
jgi:hypothetical protein